MHSISLLKIRRNFSGYDYVVDQERELCGSDTGNILSRDEGITDAVLHKWLSVPFYHQSIYVKEGIKKEVITLTWTSSSL